MAERANDGGRDLAGAAVDQRRQSGSHAARLLTCVRGIRRHFRSKGLHSRRYAISVGSSSTLVANSVR